MSPKYQKNSEKKDVPAVCVFMEKHDEINDFCYVIYQAKNVNPSSIGGEETFDRCIESLASRLEKNKIKNPQVINHFSDDYPAPDFLASNKVKTESLSKDDFRKIKSMLKKKLSSS
jgi:hypothetical protein